MHRLRKQRRTDRGTCIQDIFTSANDRLSAGCLGNVGAVPVGRNLHII